MLLLARAFVLSGVGPAAFAAPAGAAGERQRPGYLQRQLMAEPRHLDHGVLGVAVGGGWPHLYRLELGLGLLDHVTVGATAHWLPGQNLPQVAPVGALAFWRSRWLSIGASYRQVLHPPPRDDEDPETPGFPGRTHYVLGSVTFSRAVVAAGFDLGLARLRAPDPAQPDEADRWVTRNRLGGGLHLRVGTRRFGLTAHAALPELAVEAVLDVRFSLFERRSRGGWLDY
jgi:hypothetical protein